MTPTDKTKLTDREAEHIELMHMIKLSLESTRKLIEMWDRESGRVDNNKQEPCFQGAHDWEKIADGNPGFYRCKNCGVGS